MQELLKRPRAVSLADPRAGACRCGSLNALTDQPLAIKCLILFKAPGTIEKCSGPPYVALPLLRGLHRNPCDCVLWLAVGAALITACNRTDWNDTHTNR